MDLMAWRNKHSLNRIEVAGMLGISVWTLGRYENRLKPVAYLPPRSMIRKIIEITNGEVLPNDLFGEKEIAHIIRKRNSK